MMRNRRRISRTLKRYIEIYTVAGKEYLKSQGIMPTDDLIIEFIKWRATEDWTQFKQSVMDKELIIKNNIEALDLRLPNGKKGIPYKASISIPTELADDYHITGLEGSGLQFELNDRGEGIISGTPEIANDYTLTLSYHCNGCNADRGNYNKEIQLTINPDPRDLWKDIPTPGSIEYYRPDSESVYMPMDQKCIIAASQRGRSHAHEGRPRDDSFKVIADNSTGWFILAVADGAGSAIYSRKGAEIAVETATQYCLDFLKVDSGFEQAISKYHSQTENENARKTVSDFIYRIVGSSAFKANRAIHHFQETEHPEGNIKDFSTTLLLAICKKFDFGWFVASFWVGDGAMAIYTDSTKYLKLLGVPDGGEYAGQTRFLTMDSIFSSPVDIMKRLRFSIETDFSALILMTDGVSDAKFETDANLNRIEKWDELWNDLKTAITPADNDEATGKQLIEWLKFWSTGNHDDRTIAILY